MTGEHFNSPIESNGEHEHQAVVLPVLELYAIRHGTTGVDKANPNRALLPEGKVQVAEATNKIINQLIADRWPDFDHFNDVEARRRIFANCLSELRFRLYDSGTTRTLEQVALEREILLGMGVPQEHIHTPNTFRQYLEDLPVEEQERLTPLPDSSFGPGIVHHLKGIKGLDEQEQYRQKLANSEFQQSVNAVDDVTAWLRVPEDDLIKLQIETPKVVEARVRASLERLGAIAKIVEKRAKHNEDPVSIVVIANSHGSNITLGAATALEIDQQDITEQVDNAEGFRMVFGADGPRVEPFGEGMEHLYRQQKEPNQSFE